MISIPLLAFRPTCLLFLGSVGLAAAATTLYDQRLWRSRWLPSCAAALCAPIALGLALWRFGAPGAAAFGVNLVWSLLPLLGLGGIGMLVAAPINRFFGLIARLRSREARSARAGARRKFLWDAAALLPAGAFSAGSVAMAGNDSTRVVNVPFTFHGLPPALHGLRILHLSDLHLGAGRTAADLRELLDGLRSDPPDLIALTGDVADRLDELQEGLKAVTEFGARLGVYAALGNHEYLNDIERMLPAYLESSVRLLRNAGEAVRVGDATLFVAGVDDPIFSGPLQPFYERTVKECAAGAPAEGFRLLLCHRPDGFEAAAACGFHLTLSGHTHGGQVGLLGRSAFEVLFGVPYLWGSYRRGQSRLYTTSGFGHWFPFRLNCPAEAAIITLLAS